jgi:hypothetical protein
VRVTGGCFSRRLGDAVFFFFFGLGVLAYGSKRCRQIYRALGEGNKGMRVL